MGEITAIAIVAGLAVLNSLAASKLHILSVASHDGIGLYLRSLQEKKTARHQVLTTFQTADGIEKTSAAALHPTSFTKNSKRSSHQCPRDCGKKEVMQAMQEGEARNP
jgi:hypothetical protein